VSRRGGEDFRPAHGTHRRPLRKWLQEHGVLPWRRQDLPLVVDEHGGLVAIADLGCAAGFAAEPGEPSWRVTWRGRGIVTESDAFGFKWPGRPSIG
jgi:tRNA(Ile)-lysidine synthetase-like protein